MFDRIPIHPFINAIALSGVGVGTTAISLSTQLNAPHVLFYLYVPFWVVIVSVLIVIALASALSALTEKSKSMRDRSSKFAISIIVGIFISFIVFPLFKGEPDPPQLLLWAGISSFIGNGLLLWLTDIRNDLFSDDELKSEMHSSVKTRIKGLMTFFVGGSDK